MTQEFRDKSHKSHVAVTPLGSGPKSLAQRLKWMADNLPGFREELEAVDQAQRRATQKSPPQVMSNVDDSTGERA